jgi:hypothetical protein
MALAVFLAYPNLEPVFAGGIPWRCAVWLRPEVLYIVSAAERARDQVIDLAAPSMLVLLARFVLGAAQTVIVVNRQLHLCCDKALVDAPLGRADRLFA